MTTDIKSLCKRALELSEKATKGPWKLRFDADNEADAIILDTKENTACNSEDDVYDTVCTLPVEKYGYGCAWASEPNGKLIVESRTLLPQIAAAYLALSDKYDEISNTLFLEREMLKASRQQRGVWVPGNEHMRLLAAAEKAERLEARHKSLREGLIRTRVFLKNSGNNSPQATLHAADILTKFIDIDDTAKGQDKPKGEAK